MKLAIAQSYDNLDEVINLIKWFTRFSVIHIFNKEEGHTLKNLLLHIVTAAFMGLLFTCNVISLFYCWDDFLKFIESIIACFRILCQWIILQGSYDKIREIISECREFRNKYVKDIQKENLEVYHNVFIKRPTLIVKIFLCNFSVAGTIITTAPFFKSERSTPILAYLPIGQPLETPHFELNFIWCAFIIPCIITTIIGIDSIFIVLVSEVCLQLHVIKYKLSSLGNEGEDDPDKILREIQQIHSDIIRRVRSINEAFSSVLAIEFTAILLMLSVALFMVVNNNFNFIIWILAFVAQLGFYCLLGEVLKDKFENVFFALYNNKFYNLNIKIRKSLVLMMTCAQRTPTLTAGSLAELSLMNYFQILKKAFSFFTVMRDNQDKN